jgi:hypothetical protein
MPDTNPATTKETIPDTTAQTQHTANRKHKTAETRDRTGDLQIFSLTLSQLSYRGRWGSNRPALKRQVARTNVQAQTRTLPGRLELPTLRLTASRSNQLSYGSTRNCDQTHAGTRKDRKQKQTQRNNRGKRNPAHRNHQRPRGPMDKASAHGAGDCRFESCRGHVR